MPFKRTVAVCSWRIRTTLFFFVVSAFLSQSAHADRVLSETKFDERGVEARTFDGLNQPSPELSDEQVIESVDVEEEKSRSNGLVKFFSRLFGKDAEGERSSRSSVENSSPPLEIDSTSDSSPRQGAALNGEQATQRRIRALIGDEASAERLQAIFGDSDTEVSADSSSAAQPSQSSISTEPAMPPEIAAPDTAVEESISPAKPSSGQLNIESKVEEINQDGVTNLIQRFLGLFKRGTEPSFKDSEQSEIELSKPKLEATERPTLAESFAAEIPSIQGRPENGPNQDNNGLAVVPKTPSVPTDEVPEPGVSGNRSFINPPARPELILPRPRSQLPPPVVASKDKKNNGENDVLNPLMIGKKLDSFAYRLIDDLRRGEGLESFDAFAKTISDVFFSTPTVLRLVELEKTINTQIDEAEALSRPQVSLSAEEGRRTVSGGGSDGRISSQTVTATQSVWDFGIIDSGVQQSRNNVDKTLAEIRASRSEALLDLIGAYTELLTARLNMELVQVFAETRVQFLDLVDQKLALGVSSRADLVRAEAKAYEAQGELPVAAQRLQAAEDRFVELFGIVAPEELPAYRLPAKQLNLAELGQMIEGHPSVRAAELDYQNAQLSLQRLSSEKLGAFNFQVSGSRSDTPTTSVTDQLDAKIIYQVDLYDGGDLSARLERASGAVVEARWELERVRRETRRIIESAISELVASQSLESARLNSLEATLKASDATKELFMYDRGDLTDIFRVQDDYLNAAKALVEARASSISSYYSSLHAANLLVDKFGLGI